jgi:putative hydrolase of the HAD superfamily
VPINQECWKLYQYDKITHEELRYNRLKHSLTLNYSISDSKLMLLRRITFDFTRKQSSFDGTFEVLDYLNQKYKLHIITNGFAAVQYKK